VAGTREGFIEEVWQLICCEFISNGFSQAYSLLKTSRTV